MLAVVEGVVVLDVAPQSRYPSERLTIVLGRIARVIGQTQGRLRIIGHSEAAGDVLQPNGPAREPSSQRAAMTPRSSGIACCRRAASPRSPMPPMSILRCRTTPALSSNRRIDLVIFRDKPILPGGELF